MVELSEQEIDARFYSGTLHNAQTPESIVSMPAIVLIVLYLVRDFILDKLISPITNKLEPPIPSAVPRDRAMRELEAKITLYGNGGHYLNKNKQHCFKWYRVGPNPHWNALVRELHALEDTNRHLCIEARPLYFGKDQTITIHKEGNVYVEGPPLPVNVFVLRPETIEAR